MHNDAERLKSKIAALASRVDDKFLELARHLRALQETDPAGFSSVVESTTIGRRRAYYLVSISPAFDGLPVSDARLESIGWTKLQVLTPHVDADNVGDLLDLAEGATAYELQGAAEDLPRAEEHCVLLRMTKADYARFLDVMVAFGAVRRGRGLQNKEAALRRLMEVALAKLDPDQCHKA